MRIFSSLSCRLAAVVLLLAGVFILPALAESERVQQRTQRQQARSKNVAPAAYSCYTHLTMMVRGSSFSVPDKLRPSLRLSVERDDGDLVLVNVLRGGGQKSAAASSATQIGWITYHPASQSLKDVSQIVENEDKDAAFAGDVGKNLNIDRRFAYLFNQCRQRHDVAQAASCRQRQQQSNIETKALSLRGQGQVARLDRESYEKITLYSAPDAACYLSQDLVLKAGTALKIYSEADDFYFVRQDGLKQGFVTGWILKEHVQNIKFVIPPASEQTQNVTLIPADKPVSAKEVEEVAQPTPIAPTAPRAKPTTPPKLAEPARLQVLEPEFDAQASEIVPQEAEIVPQEAEIGQQDIVMTQTQEEEARIPIPLAAKPLPPDMEPKPARRRPRSNMRNNDSGRDS